MRTLPAGLIAVLVLAVSLAAAVAGASDAPPIEVSVDCVSSPERVRITNNRAKPIVIKSVGSTYQRRAGEPYKVRQKLKPGKTVTYSFGRGDGGKRLSGSYILDNDSPREAVLVKADKGRVKVRCIDGTNARPEPDPVPEPASPPGIAPESAADEPVDAMDLLWTLQLASPHIEGYERSLFPHWIDADGDGCDTRQEVLISESLVPATVGSGCTVESGEWYSAPDGDTLTNPASMDINHVVPLKEAWASGASEWTTEERVSFANDLADERTLQAVSAGANRQQGDRDPSSWLPADRETACRFVVDWVAIKASWSLAVDDDERLAIASTLGFCDDREVTVVEREPAVTAATQ